MSEEKHHQHSVQKEQTFRLQGFYVGRHRQLLHLLLSSSNAPNRTESRKNKENKRKQKKTKENKRKQKKINETMGK